MKGRKTLRRRIVLLALASAFSAAAVLLLLFGLSRLRAVQRRDSGFQAIHRELLGYIGEMRREVALLELGAQAASSERLQGLVSECSESIDDLRKDFADLLQDQPAHKQMEDEWTELAAVGHGSWARYAVDLGAFEGYLDRVREELEERLALARQTALAFCGAGVLAAGAAALFCVWVVLTVLSDIASDAYDPTCLADEVAALASQDQFKARINLLVPAEDRQRMHDDWELRMTRRRSERRTHVCFEALALRHDAQVELWGRRYKWAGYAKSFQRVFLPVYAEATWRALCLMHNNGLGAPVPIVFKKLRAGPFRAGAIIVMEHLGEVESVREFLVAHFCLLSAEQQDAFLHRMAAFLHSLHDLGIYGVKPRYLHGKRMAEVDRLQLYLFDLDKIVLWKSCPRLVAAMLRRKDRRRLLREIEPVLSDGQLSKLRQWLASRPEGLGS